MIRRNAGICLLAMMAGCGGDSSPASPTPPASLVLTSTGFATGATIPAQHRCTGANVSPPLAWTGGPQAQAYALIVEDPDAPGGIFVHWVLYNIPGAARSLAQDASPGGPLPAGTQQGSNDFGLVRYTGPCPPAGQMHRYFFRLFALSERLNLPDGATAAQVRQAMQGRETAQAELMGNSPR